MPTEERFCRTTIAEGVGVFKASTLTWINIFPSLPLPQIFYLNRGDAEKDKDTNSLSLMFSWCNGKSWWYRRGKAEETRLLWLVFYWRRRAYFGEDNGLFSTVSDIMTG
jgi:hypothetical protein